MATRPNTGSASAFPTSLIAQAVPMLTRHELAALTERLLERLDEIDGDFDLEDDTEDCCEAADDGLAPRYRNGVRYWGSGEDHAPNLKPIYGIDQTEPVSNHGGLPV